MRRLAVLDFAARQSGKNLLDQVARGLRAQFHRHAFTTAFRLVDEVDAERMIERGMEGVIIIDIGVSIRIQPFGPLALPRSLAFSTMYEHMMISRSY